MATVFTPMTGSEDTSPRHAVVGAVAALALAYGVAACFQVPQQWTTAALGHGAAHAEEHAAGSEGDSHATSHAAEALAPPALWSVLPFVALLAAIAVFPLMHATEHWWEENVNRFKVAVALGLATLAYYGFVHRAPIEAHWPGHAIVAPTGSWCEFGLVKTVLANAMLSEYVPFIVLLFSLYTIAGGIRIEGDLQATPATNAKFMAAGGLLASLIGTTGAAMLLIRPLLETNRERKHVAHTVVFFIFIVCNCGGCLLPIGDPPLFLGYLEGVDFSWTLSLWGPWLLVNGLLLAAYLAADRLYFFRREQSADVRRDAVQVRRLTIDGLRANGPLLIGVVLAVALLDPKKTLPGTSWHPWMYMRELVQLGLVALSLRLGSARVRTANNFNYAAIIEVAALFVGIFICMQPALQILGAHGADLVERYQLGPMSFFWATGALSSFLDNAPTYLVFFKTVQHPELHPVTGGVEPLLLTAISLGAVFMGAMTYIGNGPNFMVKAIAEKSGVRMPSFFGYMAYSCGILLPILAVANWAFLAD